MINPDNALTPDQQAYRRTLDSAMAAKDELSLTWGQIAKITIHVAARLTTSSMGINSELGNKRAIEKYEQMFHRALLNSTIDLLSLAIDEEVAKSEKVDG